MDEQKTSALFQLQTTAFSTCHLPSNMKFITNITHTTDTYALFNTFHNIDVICTPSVILKRSVNESWPVISQQLKLPSYNKIRKT